MVDYTLMTFSLEFCP